MADELPRTNIAGTPVTAIVERFEAAESASANPSDVFHSMSQSAGDSDDLARDDTDAATIDTAATFGSDNYVAEINHLSEQAPSDIEPPPTAVTRADESDDVNEPHTADFGVVNDTLAQTSDTHNIGSQVLAESKEPNMLQTSPTSLSTVTPPHDDAPATSASVDQPSLSSDAADHSLGLNTASHAGSSSSPPIQPSHVETTEMSSFASETQGNTVSSDDAEVDVDSRLHLGEAASMQPHHNLAPILKTDSNTTGAQSGDREGTYVFVAAADNQPIRTAEIVREAEQGLAQLESTTKADDQPPVTAPGQSVSTSHSYEPAVPSDDPSVSKEQEETNTGNENHETQSVSGGESLSQNPSTEGDPVPIVDEIDSAEVDGESTSEKPAAKVSTSSSSATTEAISESPEGDIEQAEEKPPRSSEEDSVGPAAHVPLLTSSVPIGSAPPRSPLQGAHAASSTSAVNTSSIAITLTKQVTVETPNKTTISSLALERSATAVDTMIITDSPSHTSPIPIVTIPANDSSSSGSTKSNTDVEVKTIPLTGIISSKADEAGPSGSTNSVKVSSVPASPQPSGVEAVPEPTNLDNAEESQQGISNEERGTNLEVGNSDNNPASAAGTGNDQPASVKTSTNTTTTPVVETGVEPTVAPVVVETPVLQANVDKSVASGPSDIEHEGERTVAFSAPSNDVDHSHASKSDDSVSSALENEADSSVLTDEQKKPETISGEKSAISPSISLEENDNTPTDESSVDEQHTATQSHAIEQVEDSTTSGADDHRDDGIEPLNNSNNSDDLTNSPARRESAPRSTASVHTPQDEESCQSQYGRTVEQVPTQTTKEDENMGAVLCIPTNLDDSTNEPKPLSPPGHPALRTDEQSPRSGADGKMAESNEKEDSDIPRETPSNSQPIGVTQDNTVVASESTVLSSDSRSSTVEPSGSATTASSAQSHSSKVDPAVAVTTDKEQTDTASSKSAEPKSPVELIQEQLTSDDAFGGPLSFEDVLEGDDDFTNIVTDVEKEQKRAQAAAPAVEPPASVPESVSKASPAVATTHSTIATADVFSREEAQSMPSLRTPRTVVGITDSPPATPAPAAGRTQSRSTSRSPVGTPSRSPSGTPLRSGSSSPRTPKLDRLLPAPGTRGTDRMTRAIAPMRAMASELRSRASGSRIGSPSSAGRRGSLPASVERPPRLPRVARLAGLNGRHGTPQKARDDTTIGTGSASSSSSSIGGAVERGYSELPPPRKWSPTTPSSRLPRVAGLHTRSGGRSSAAGSLSPQGVGSARGGGLDFHGPAGATAGTAGGSAARGERSMLPLAGRRETNSESLRRTMSLTHDRVQGAGGRASAGRLSGGPADLRVGGSGGSRIADRRASLMAAGELGRPRVTVPKPFHLSGEGLQEKTMAAIEEARRKAEELENRRRVFVARPMPDFSRPSPQPKLK